MWDADYTDLYERYVPLLGKATYQQLARKNSEVWRSHLELLSLYRVESNQAVTEKPSPPGYWGNREDGYELHGLVRNDLYDFDWKDSKVQSNSALVTYLKIGTASSTTSA